MEQESIILSKISRERMGGSVGQASDFSSGHDLTVCECEPRVGLCADSWEPGVCFKFCVSLFLCSSPTHGLSLSPSNINKNILKIFLKKISQRKTNTIWFHSYLQFKKQNKWAKDEERERETKKRTLNFREQTGGCQSGGGWRDELNRWRGLTVHVVMSTEECTESLYCPLETNIMLYVNCTGMITKTFKKSPKVSGNMPYYNRFLPHLYTSTLVSEQGTKKAFVLPK